MDESFEFLQLKTGLEALERRVAELEAPEALAEDVEVIPTFEELVQWCDPRSLQVLIREASIYKWAKASVTLPINLVEKIRNNISVNAWTDFVADSHEIKYLRELNSYRQEILRIMRQLESVGEIVVAWESGYRGIRRGEPIAFIAGNLPYPIQERPVDPEVTEWFENVLQKAGSLPRIRPSSEGSLSFYV